MNRKAQMNWDKVHSHKRGAKKCVRCDGKGVIGLRQDKKCPVCFGSGKQ